MTLTDIAKEYRENATLLKERIEELRRQLEHTENNRCSMRIKSRILHYENVYADNMSAACHLENYYNK